MKALILIGSFGNRMRPLTLSVPKPLVEFANKSILQYQIEALVNLGCVDEIILAINFSEDALHEKLELYRQKYNIKITCSVEDEPLGTAGPIKKAQNILKEKVINDPKTDFDKMVNDE